jgi:type VI secretion system protein ImpK
VTPKLKPLIEKLARALKNIPSHVSVIGYSDSQNIKTAEFPNNQVLSEKRAASVAQVLVSNGAPRVKAMGKGSAEPVASNVTAKGRALNRRVEIVIEQ